MVVFDIGGVLVDWRPELAWADDMGSVAAARDFMARSGFLTLNIRADAGARFADLAREVPEPEDAARIAQYVARFDRTVQDAVPGSWDIVERLMSRGVPLHAITNWSAETWPIGLRVQPRLASVFGVTVVSGQEGIAKPDPRIFGLLCARAGVSPGDCVFVDDSPANVAAARSVGMDAIAFTDAAALDAALRRRGLL